MKNDVLEQLVSSGDLSSYTLETVEFEPGSGSREWDQLMITLPSGKKLIISAVCSGSLENTTIIVDLEGHHPVHTCE
jgi:hypothetical protein